MAQQHFNEFSYKTVRISSNFLHSIWQPAPDLNIEANIYHDYYKIGKYNYVNDFSNRCWKKTSELSPEQVVCIHEDNKIQACKNNTAHFNRRVFGIDRSSFDSPSSSDSIMSLPSFEMVVTDEFLDNLQIPKGKREERITIMKKQSELFSRFLSLHIGTERIVKLRRLLLNKCANIMNIAGTMSFEIIGSRSEGLDMAGSDTDVLVVMNLTAHESGEQSDNAILTVEYDSLMDDIHPGYVILEEIGSSNEIHKMINTSKNSFYKEFHEGKQHGPALMQSVLGADYDHVISIKSESWPKIAMEWINRNRKFGWPSQEMIYSIVRKGCHIVPVGSSRNHAADEDWRLSRLIQFVIEENCPNYFVICNNMFHERFDTLDKETLLQVLCDITSTGWQWVLKTKTLERFPKFMTRHEVNEDILENTVYKREQLDTFKLLDETVLRCRQTTCFMMSKIIPTNKSFLATIFKVPILRQKTVSMLFHFIDTNNTNFGNKILYALHKFQMQLLTMESMDNLISGKILLASWLYTRGEYTESLQVTDAGLRNLDLCLFHKGKKIMKDNLFGKVLSSTRDFTEIFYLSSSDYTFPIRSSLVPREIRETFGSQKINLMFQYRLPMIYYCPRSYSYFLRCLCYLRLGDTRRYEHEYKEMMSVCDMYCGNFKSIHQANNLTLKLVCNKIRHNISLDFNNSFEAARVLIQHLSEFKLTISELEDFMKNFNELVHRYGISPRVINDLIST
ncbi:unnamed protein product [Mytilus coruscus]|uniref:Mab-21-like nucleotidyltransferase domain-containing protein n=1 Tax=Mytilus coruscus TaxID=42192 RepID=A0A6J8EP83_MYTCO|nr:unnamed protein product [Mytilus coruscus]